MNEQVLNITRSGIKEYDCKYFTGEIELPRIVPMNF